MNPKLIVTGNTHPADTAASKSESFYKLTGSDAKHLYDLGVFSAQAYVLMIIRSHGAVGWKWTFKVKDFCKEWCIGERNFYRAISKLKALDLIHWEAKDTITVWYGSDIAQDASNNTTSVQKASILVSKQKAVENLETRSSCKLQATISTNTLTNVSLTDKSVSPTDKNVSPTDKNVSPLTKVSVPLTKVSQEIAETLVNAEPPKTTDYIQSNKIFLEQADMPAAFEKTFAQEKELEPHSANQIQAAEEEANKEEDGIDCATDELDHSPKLDNPEVNEIVIALRDAEMLNPELKAEALKYPLADVQAALRLYQQRSKQKPIDNTQGWMTRCLQNRWWAESKQTATAAQSLFPLELVEWYEKACAAGIVDGRDLRHCPGATTMGNIEQLQVVIPVPAEERHAYLSPFKFVLWRDAITQFPL